MENRRRLGKRHMGELHLSQMHPSAPLWELGSSVDLTQWQWKPPTSSDARHLPPHTSAGPTAWGIVRDWLSIDTRDAGSHLAAMPQMMWQPEASSKEAMEHVLPAHTINPIHVPNDLSNILQSPVTTGFNLDIEDPARVVEKAINSLILDASFDSSLQTRANFDAFCCSLQEVIAGQRVSGHAAYTVVKELSSGLVQHLEISNCIESNKVARTLMTRLYPAVLDGLAEDYAIHGNRFHEFQSLYSLLLAETPGLHGNTLRLFERIMSDIPEDCVGKFAAGIVSNMSNSLVALSRPYEALPTSGKARTNIMRQINKMADCLAKLDSAEHADILEEVTQQLLLFQGSEKSNFKTMRFCWLQVVARLPKVQDEFLSKTCTILEAGVSVRPLSPHQICGIFLGRLNNRLSPKHVMPIYKVVATSSAGDCYANLSSKLWQTNQARYIKRLCTFLIQLDRRQDIVQLTRGLRKHIKNDSAPLANLAIGLGHPQLALWMYIRYHQSRWQSKIFWNTRFATEMLKMLLKVKDMESKNILQVLKMFPARRRQPSRTTVTLAPGKRMTFTSRCPPEPKLSRRHVQKTETVALAFADTPSISNRTALTRISQCIQFLQSHNAPIPPRVLGAVFHLITRDLAAGRPGRTTRFRWFLALLLKEEGPDKVLEAALVLKKWRDVLYQRELKLRETQRSTAPHRGLQARLTRTRRL